MQEQPKQSVADDIATLAGSIGGGATSSTWTTNGTGTFSNAASLTSTYNPSTADSTAGTVKLYLTTDAPGTCLAVVDSVIITLDPLPTVDAGTAQTICADDIATLAGSIGGGATSSTWTTNGTGTFSNAASLTSTYNPSTADSTAGTVKLYLTTDAPGTCLATVDSVIITLDPLPTVDAGTAQTICADDIATLAGSIGGGGTSSTWTTNGTGTFSNAASLTSTYNPSTADSTAGTVKLYLTTDAPGTCLATVDSVIITLDPLPTANLAVVTDTTICNGGMVQIRITSTETGVNYQLRDDSDNSLVFAAMGGNNGTITFSIDPVTSSVTYNILATNGTTNCFVELVDMAVITVQDCDLGDLQDTDADTTAGNYQTLIANGGPIHYIRPDLKLGENIDGEADGNPHGMARGDDDDAVPDDEDGVMFFSSLNIVPGGIIRLPLSVTNGTGSMAHLEGWIDWDGDGRF